MFELPEEGRQGSVQQGRQGMKIKPHDNSLTAHDSTQQQMQQQQAGPLLTRPKHDHGANVLPSPPCHPLGNA